MLNQSNARNSHIEVEKVNNWYVADQFEQLNKPGTRAVIEERWKCFRDIIIHYLQIRVPHRALGPINYLDAGCGDGINLQWASGFFHEQCIGARITALDYNSLRIDRVKKKQLAAETYVASLLEMPFEDSTFDMILCSHVLEHVEMYQVALKEIFRILKPGGLLIVGVPNEGCFLAWLRNRIVQRSIMRKTDHVNFFRSKTINEALMDAGFNVIRTYHEGFFIPNSWVHYALSCFTLGRSIISILGRIFPNQSSGLITYVVKRGDNS